MKFLSMTKDKPIVIYGNAIVTCDWHIPFQNELIQKMIEIAAKEHNINQLIVGGDLFNQDSFSRFEKKEENANWDLEMERGREWFRWATKHFISIYVVLGNHDERISKRNNYILRFEHIVRMITDEEQQSKITLSEKDFCNLISTGENYRVHHAKNYRKVPGSLGWELAKKYNTHIITGHPHNLFHETKMNFGRIIHVIDGGCCLEADKVEYYNSQTTVCNKWTPGFVIIKDGKPEIVSPEIPTNVKREWR